MSDVADGVTAEAHSDGRLAGLVALITGASRGIGAAIARRFAEEGAQVILVARTVGGLEAVDDQIQSKGRPGATLVPLDLTEFDKIDQMAAAIAQRFGRLDVLVGNAGILGALSPVGHFDPKTWNEVFALNVTANWRLIRAFDPLLRAAPAGRAVFVTAGVASQPLPYWGAYAASKAALEAMAKTYAGEITKTKVKVNVIDPGVARTKLRAQAFPGEAPEKQPEPETLTDAFVTLAAPDCPWNGKVVRAY
jgi:NAD(P)-dependent dehydrogenase (short-subunit alcohol dehydrogenase family)